MQVLKTFWSLELLWLLLVAGLFTGLGALFGSGADAVARAPAWIGTALLLASYPAGIGTRPAVFTGEAAVGRLAVFLVASASATLAAFVFVNWIGPALLPASDGPGLPDVAAMTLAQVRTALEGARPPADSGSATVAAWLPYNHLAFHYVRRLEGMLVPALLAWVGLFTGYWSHRLPSRPARRMAQWGMGAFLVVTLYFAGENGYELIVLRAAGPAEFAGDLVLLVPATLALGMGMATYAAVFGREDAAVP